MISFAPGLFWKLITEIPPLLRQGNKLRARVDHPAGTTTSSWNTVPRRELDNYPFVALRIKLFFDG